MCKETISNIVTLAHPTCDIINKSLSHVQILQYKIGLGVPVIDTKNNTVVYLTLNMTNDNEGVNIEYPNTDIKTDFILFSNADEVLKRLQYQHDRSKHYALCGYCGWTGLETELPNDPLHTCGKDECPSCKNENFITCCYKSEQSAENNYQNIEE